MIFQIKVIQVYEKAYPVAEEWPYVIAGEPNQDAQVVNIGNVEFGTLVCYDLIFPRGGARRQQRNWIFATEWGSARDMISVAVRNKHQQQKE